MPPGRVRAYMGACCGLWLRWLDFGGHMKEDRGEVGEPKGDGVGNEPAGSAQDLRDHNGSRQRLKR